MMTTKVKQPRWFTPLVCFFLGHARIGRDPFVMCWRCGLVLQDRRTGRRPMERHATEPGISARRA